VFLYFWYLGAFLKFLVSGRLIVKEWVRHLPGFSIFVFACTMKTLFLIPLVQSAELYATVTRMIAPWIACLQVAAAVEAFIIFANWVPRFRRFGIGIMAASVAVAVGLVQWTAPANQADLPGAATAALERGVGFGVAIVLAIAMFSYRLFDHGQPRAAYWHACCLAFLSFTNAVGWQMIQQGVSGLYATWIMVLGGVIPFVGWLLIVKQAPTGWKMPLPAILDLRNSPGAPQGSLR
jgi:hypothetical protein